MLGKSVLLRPSSTDIRRQATALLRAAGNEVVTGDDAERCTALLEAGAADVVILDTGDGALLAPVAEEARRRGVPVIAMAPTADAELRELFDDGLARHLLIGTDRLRGCGVTVEKVLRESYFGLDKYIPAFGIETYRFELRGPESLRDALECLDDLVRTAGAGDSAAAELLAVAGELADNALYSAPRLRDLEGRVSRRRYTRAHRQQGIEVDPDESAALELAFDGTSMFVAVADRFGSLTPDHIRRAVGSRSSRASTAPARALRRGTRGGLRRVHELSTELSFNLTSGQRTEVIARRHLGDEPGYSGLHIFCAATEDVIPGAVERTIEVSSSMLVDIRQHIAARVPSPVVTLPRKRLPGLPKRAESEAETLRQTASGGDDQSDRREMIEAPAEPVGIDTLLGLLHGASSVQRALEIGLRFLTVCYRGAVAYRIDDGAMHPVMAAGQVENWADLRTRPVELFSSSTLAAMAASGLSGRYRPQEAHELDPELGQLCAGDPRASGYVITVKLQRRPRYVLFGLARLYHSHLAKKVARQLESELSDCIGKHLDERPERALPRRASTAS